MKKSNKARGAICAALVSALTIGGASLTLAPEFAYATELEGQGQATAASAITFTDEGATIPEGLSGVTAKGGDVTISEPGTYTFTGSCANGSISVKKELQGVTVVDRKSVV